MAPLANTASALSSTSSTAGTVASTATVTPSKSVSAAAAQAFAQALISATQQSMLQDDSTMMADDSSDGSDGSGDSSSSDDMSSMFGNTSSSGSSPSMNPYAAMLSGNSSSSTTSGTPSMFASNPVLLALDMQLGINPLNPTAQSGTSSTLNAPVTGGGNAAPLMSNVKTVAAAAQASGADPTTAVAMMLVESGGDNTAVGDNGTSFGLFQLHEGGMLSSAGLTPQQAFDPATNARVAIGSLAATQRSMPHASPGAIAAASQRPADQAGYAAKVNAQLSRAGALLAQSAMSS